VFVLIPLALLEYCNYLVVKLYRQLMQLINMFRVVHPPTAMMQLTLSVTLFPLLLLFNGDPGISLPGKFWN